MSHYIAYAKHPKTKKIELCKFIDGMFGADKYGIVFPGGETFSQVEWDIREITNQEKNKFVDELISRCQEDDDPEVEKMSLTPDGEDKHECWYKEQYDKDLIKDDWVMDKPKEISSLKEINFNSSFHPDLEYVFRKQIELIKAVNHLLKKSQ